MIAHVSVFKDMESAEDAGGTTLTVGMAVKLQCPVDGKVSDCVYGCVYGCVLWVYVSAAVGVDVCVVCAFALCIHLQ